MELTTDICAASTPAPAAASIARIRAAITHIGRPHQRHTVAVQLHYVSVGHKPAYLWDSGRLCGRPAAIAATVRQLQRSGLLATSLRCVRLHDDVLVVNRDAVERLDVESVCFVDVSGCGGQRRPGLVSADKHAELVRDCRLVIAQICTPAAAADEEEIVVVQTTACVPTIFGVLIGYPICYWYATGDVETEEDNCLSGESLRLFQLLHDDGGGTDGHRVPVFSMSCALSVFEQTEVAEVGLEAATTEWFRQRAASAGLHYRVMDDECVTGRVVL